MSWRDLIYFLYPNFFNAALVWLTTVRSDFSIRPNAVTTATRTFRSGSWKSVSIWGIADLADDPMLEIAIIADSRTLASASPKSGNICGIVDLTRDPLPIEPIEPIAPTALARWQIEQMCPFYLMRSRHYFALCRLLTSTVELISQVWHSRHLAAVP